MRAWPPQEMEQLGKVIVLRPRAVGVVAGSLRGLAQEMKSMMGPWPSKDGLARLDLLETAARYLDPPATAPASNVRNMSVKAYAAKRRATQQE